MGWERDAGREMSILLTPLEQTLADPRATMGLVRRLGGPVIVELGPLDGAVRSIRQVRRSLMALATSSDDEVTAAVVEAIGAAWTAVDAIGDTLDDLATYELPDPVEAATQLAEAITRLPQHLIVAWLDRRLPLVSLALRATGVLARDPSSPASIEVLHPDQFADLLADPGTSLATFYNWQTGHRWHSLRLLDALKALGRALGVTAQWSGIPGSWIDNDLVASDHSELETASVLRVPLLALKTSDGVVIEQAGLLIGPLGPDAGAVLDGAFVSPFSTITASDLTLGGFALESPIDLDAPTFGVRFKPGGVDPVGTFGDVIRLGVNQVDPIRIGDPDSPLAVVSGVRAGVEFPPAGGDVGIDAAASLRILLRLGGGDSFLGTLLGDVEAEASAALAYDGVNGLSVDFDAGFEIVVIPPDLPGPIDLTRVRLWTSLSAAAIDLGVAVDTGATIGIASFTVADVGFIGQIGLEQPPTFDWRFKWPSGVGLTIGTDDSPVRGGGYLAVYPDEGRYEAVIDLQIVKVGVSAFVLVDTRSAGGAWSMFFALFIDLPGIQLGFGFSLEGVGGVAGINRTVDPEALLSAVRSGSVAGILFPDDPIGDAPMIIDAFRSFFPPAQGRFVFGPVVQIGWGGGIVLAQLGVIVELPAPVSIVVLGSVRAVLPDDEVAAVVLAMSVAGVIDFGEGTIAFDATLEGSQIAGFPLSGGASLRAGLRGQPTFLLAVGGFHPGFSPPAGFPQVPRIGLEITFGDVVAISMEAYVAITSQTFQFGTALYLRADIDIFAVEGGFEFDALIHFNPFSLIAELNMFISVHAAGTELLVVRLNGTLEGPGPWEIVGQAEFRALGSHHVLPFDFSTGDRELPAPQVPPGLLELLVGALTAPDAWELDDGRSVGVELADPGENRRAAPDSGLVIRQRLVPLETDITVFEGNTAIEHTRFALSATGLGSGTTVLDWFSPGSFDHLGGDDSSKLATPSFERMPAGRSLIAGVQSGPARAVATDHKEIIVDPEVPLGDVVPTPSIVDLQQHTRIGDIAGAVTSWTQPVVAVAGVAPVEIVDLTAMSVDPSTGVTGSPQPISAVAGGSFARPWELEGS